MSDSRERKIGIRRNGCVRTDTQSCPERLSGPSPAVAALANGINIKGLFVVAMIKNFSSHTAVNALLPDSRPQHSSLNCFSNRVLRDQFHKASSGLAWHAAPDLSFASYGVPAAAVRTLIIASTGFALNPSESVGPDRFEPVPPAPLVVFTTKCLRSEILPVDFHLKFVTFLAEQKTQSKVLKFRFPNFCRLMQTVVRSITAGGHAAWLRGNTSGRSSRRVMTWSVAISKAFHHLASMKHSLVTQYEIRCWLSRLPVISLSFAARAACDPTITTAFSSAATWSGFIAEPSITQGNVLIATSLRV